MILLPQESLRWNSDSTPFILTELITGVIKYAITSDMMFVMLYIYIYIYMYIYINF